MADLKIRVFGIADAEPKKTITVPGRVLKIASKLIPKPVLAALQEEGIDLDKIIRLSQNPDARGTLVEVEEHGKKQKVVVALE